MISNKYLTELSRLVVGDRAAPDANASIQTYTLVSCVYTCVDWC